MTLLSALLTLAFVTVLPLYLLYKPPGLVINWIQARFPSVLFQLSTTRKVVALTIDDAPSAYTHEILEILKEHEVSATFFTIGGQVETAVQSQDGGPIVVDETITLTPGGPTTTLNGQVISAATNGIVYGGSTTVGVDAQATTGLESSESGSSKVPSSTVGDDSSAMSTTSTDEGVASATGAAMQAFKGANVAAVVAIFVAVIAV